MKWKKILYLLSIFWIAESFAFAQHAALLTYTAPNGQIKTVTTLQEWQLKRRQILDSMQAVMGPLPDRRHLPPMNIRYIDSMKGDNYTRYKILFTVAVDENVPAYLYVPTLVGTPKRRPAMLALHPTGALGKKIVDGQSSLENRAYAKELAQRGYVVIAPDYPDFGDLSNYNFNTDRYQSGTMKSIFDDIRCVDLLQSRSDVDPDHIGVIGHSLGGHSAMFVAAFDTRLKVVVSSCGWTLMRYYFNGDSLAAEEKGGKLWPWAQERYMPLFRTKYHLNPNEIPFDFDEVIAAIAPRAFFSNAPLNDANFNVTGVRKGIENVSKVYQFLDAENGLRVRYPSSKHDFPPEIRADAYRFIDSIFGFNPVASSQYSYLDNPQFLKRVGQFAKRQSQKDIVMLGNSLTARGNWPELLATDDVSNQGIGSDITLGFINRINYVFNLRPKICFIEGGVNDLVHNVSNDAIIRNLTILIDTLRQEKIIPVLNTVTITTADYQYIDPKIFNQQIKKLNKVIRELASRKAVRLIDLNPEVSDGLFRLRKYAVKDGIHYSAAGFSLWKEKIIKVLGDLDIGRNQQ